MRVPSAYNWLTSVNSALQIKINVILRLQPINIINSNIMPRQLVQYRLSDNEHCPKAQVPLVKPVVLKQLVLAGSQCKGCFMHTPSKVTR